VNLGNYKQLYLLIATEKNENNNPSQIQYYFPHIFDFYFLVTSKNSNQENLSAKKIRNALLEKINMLKDNELVEAYGLVETEKYSYIKNNKLKFKH